MINDNQMETNSSTTTTTNALAAKSFSQEEALRLKMKELKWRLMEASQVQNKANLNGIRAEANYYKKKVNKISILTDKLRAEYVQAARAGKVAETLYRNVESELLTQERLVANEKMELAKLAVECQNIGRQLYGKEYKLTGSSVKQIDEEKQRQSARLMAAKATLNHQITMIEHKRRDQVIPFEKKLSGQLDKCQAGLQKMIDSRKVPATTRLSSMYDLNNSVLKNMSSYRLTRRYRNSGKAVTDLRYTHHICPNCNVCLPDLLGKCTDKNCLYQHKSTYFMTNIEKLADLLSYKPSLAGYKFDMNLSQVENENRCRLKLKQYAARLIAKNVNEPVEAIAQNLVKCIGSNKLDFELLTMTRVIPRASHSMCSPPSPNTVTIIIDDKIESTEN